MGSEKMTWGQSGFAIFLSLLGCRKKSGCWSSGPQYLGATDRPNFGIVLDSSPDRRGRLLMQRREAAQGREEGRVAV